MADGASAVLHGFGRQCRRTDHVADGINVGDIRLTVLIYRDHAFIRNHDSRHGKIQVLDVGLPPQRDQHLLRIDRRSIAQLRDDVRNLVPLHLLDMLSAKIMAALLFKAFDELFDQLSIHKLKRIGSAIDQGDFYSQQRKDGSILAADHATSDDSQ